MYKYRITKYNPQNRSKDVYALNEWTSVSDIGKKCDKILTTEEYIYVENTYVEAFENIAKIKGDDVVVSSIEKPFSIDEIVRIEQKYNLSKYCPVNIELLKKLSNNKRIAIDEACDLVRLILREYMWCNILLNKNERFEFGYDYYMYFLTNKDSMQMLKKCVSNRLYIELLI